MRTGLLIRVAAASGAVTVVSMPANRGLALRANVANRQRRDGFSQLVVRREYSVRPMTVLPRRRDEIGEPVQKLKRELKRRELDDAIDPWPRGLPAAAGPDPGGGFVSGQPVTDAGNPAGWAADHGESLECEGGAGAVSQQVLKTLEIAGQIAIEECDPDTGVDGKPAVHPGEHVGGGRGVEQASEAARCAMLLADHINDIRRELERDPAYDRCGAAPMIVGILIVLCNTVMQDANWEQRRLLFEAYSGGKWPASGTIRQRIEEVLDGLNLRGNHWRFN